MKLKTIVCWLIFLVGLAVLGWRYWPKGYSFSFKDTPVIEALTKVRSKTGQPLLFETNLTAKVTAEIKRAPFNYVMDVIGEKSFLGWHEAYVIYRDPAVWEEFQKAAVNEAEPKLFKPQDIMALGFRMRISLDQQQAWEPVLLDFKVEKKSLEGCVKDFSKMSRARIFLDPALASQDVTVSLKQQTSDRIVKALARAAGAKVRRAVVVRGPWSMPKGVKLQDLAQEGSARTAARENFMSEMQAAVAAMPAEDRVKVQELMAKYLPVVMSLGTMTPEERKARIAEIGNDPEVQKIIVKQTEKRLENSTPEERAQMRQRFDRWHRERGDRPPPPPSTPPPSTPPTTTPPPSTPAPTEGGN
jgi:type II secretory pathway component GspD/PulD (secretin)